MSSDYLIRSKYMAGHGYNFDRFMDLLGYGDFDHEPFDRTSEGDIRVDMRLDLLNALRDIYIDQEYVVFYSGQFNDKRYIEALLSDILEKYLSEMRIRTAFRPLLINDMLRRTRVARFSPFISEMMIMPAKRAFE